MAKKIGRKPAEVVRLYYRWRNQKLVEQNRKIRAARDQANGKTRRKKKGRPRKLPKALNAPLASSSSAAIMGMQRADSDESDAEGSDWEPDEMPDRQPSCAICNTKSSSKWWKAPRTQNGLYLCDACGVSYRRYGVAIPYKPYLASLRRNSDKRNSPPVEGPPSKRQKVRRLNADDARVTMLIAICFSSRMLLPARQHLLRHHLHLPNPVSCASKWNPLRSPWQNATTADCPHIQVRFCASSTGLTVS